MKILRTDGGGENYADERLSTLKKMLLHFKINNIYLLHDHKGTLTVVWNSEPKEYEKTKVLESWNYFYESEVVHKLLTFKEL